MSRVLAAPRAGLFIVLLLSLLLLSCQRSKTTPAPAQSRVWSEHIASHTGGLVSRHAPISLRFVHDVAGADQIGRSAEDVVQIEPRIAGELRYTSAREIQLQPAKPLPPGQGYRVRVVAEKLKDVPAQLPPYEFNFHVITPDFELHSAALEAAPDGQQALALRGLIETADGESAQAVEKLLRARFGGADLPLQWTHANDNRSHQFFTAQPLQRGEQATPLQLNWNGAPLGIKKTGERSLEVPARGVFKVLDTQVLNDGRQSVRVNFSDALDANQNLAALVTLGKIKLSLRVEGSALVIYPETTITGDHTLAITEAVRNARGTRLGTRLEATVHFANERPQVRFAGKGVILPGSDALHIPLEGMNVHSVQVTAFQVYENDVGQFLQSNTLGGENELPRVGRYLWRKTLQLPQPQSNKWTRYTLDASELLRQHPGALFRLSLSIHRGNSLLACSKEENAVPVLGDDPIRNNEDLYEEGASQWDGSEGYYDYEYSGDSSGLQWSDRDNPCKDAYYRWNEGIRDGRNFLASNIGLLAKRGSGGALHVVATRLNDAQALSGASLEVRNFQNQVIASAQTDRDGFARIETTATPFYLTARKDGQVGYLKLNRASALPTSHFDTGGETVSAGLKGFIYGERGVWRPGDDIFLNFVLYDRSGRVPEGHPATAQLFNPKGQLVQSLTNTTPVGDFYRFTLKTADDAPTGTWTAKVLVGGTEFSRPLKIETVMPNRLKMELKLPEERIAATEQPAKIVLASQWLHGASATGLKADVSMKLSPTPTRFSRYAEYVFDDPARRFSGEAETVFEGRLDADGQADINLQFQPASPPPGMMQANFTTRVFENGGAFSTGVSSAPYDPFPRYLGLRLPKVDTYGYLAAGKDIPVDLAALNPKGEAQAGIRVQLKVYRIDWHWWWERNDETLSAFAEGSSHTPVAESEVTLEKGEGRTQFRIEGNTWGRYLVRACDLDGGHCSGQVVYIGYYGWDSNAQDDGGPGAAALRFSADKPKYNVGDTALLQLPAATRGRALLSIENGSSVLDTRWVELSGEQPVLKLPITAAMAPNVFVSLTLVQPHSGRDNDRPIRLYGIVPVEVLDPATELQPRVQSADLWRPNSTVKVEVSEAQGRAMTYTLAVVDEGLLGLTNFKTPNPHSGFYRREALGVLTWDLFDEVAGAYGAELERLLALGGDQGGPIVERAAEKRFPPVVRVLGPFQLPAGKTQVQDVELPNYIGSVRLMVVAGEHGAYGVAEKNVTVRDPVSLLATLPRVLGPGETLQMPVSVFAYENDVRKVTLNIETDAGVDVVGERSFSLDFDRPGERMAWFGLKVKPRTGNASVTVRAKAGNHQTQTRIALQVRASNPVVAKATRKVLKPGEEWTQTVKPFGIENSNSVNLEVSRVPAMDLERRLDYLIQYPHGCIEQTTSSVFPQLHLGSLVEMSAERRKQTEANIKAGIERLRGFQTGNGAFAYWPGQSEVQDWSNNYAGHFLVEAKRAGYLVPADMLDRWQEYQRNAATAWSDGGRRQSDHGIAYDDAGVQAYRLLTLALADRPEIGAMNRLRETGKLDPVSRWMLAWAYSHVGLADAASEVLRGEQKIPDYRTPGYSFGSATRDRGILLSTLAQIGDLAQAERVAEQLAKELSSDSWYSTQSTAYGLLGMARFSGGKPQAETFAYSYTAGKSAAVAVTARNAMSQHELPNLKQGGALSLRNTSEQNLFVNILQRGSPPPGEEEAAASEGLELSVSYTKPDGSALDVAKIPQGQDFIARVRVSNRSGVDLEDLALTQIVASGWEIANPRFTSEGEQPPSGTDNKVDYQDIRDDRVLSYFKLRHNQSVDLKVLLNASYRGHYYLPAVSVESMYDARKQARTAGQWTDVVGR